MKTYKTLTENIEQEACVTVSGSNHSEINSLESFSSIHRILNSPKIKIHLLQFISAALITFIFPMLSFAQAPNLGLARGFVLYTGNGALDNVATSTITGHIGTHDGAITGFNPPTVVNGNIEWNNSVTAQCLIDVKEVYDELKATPPTVTNHTPAFGGGEILFAGVYNIGGAGSIAGEMTLDAQGDPNAIFIFQFGGAFTTGASSTVYLVNGASACNVFWASEAAISMAASTDIKGTLISKSGAVSMGVNGKLHGRMLTVNGAVNVYQVEITVVDCCELLKLNAVATDETCAGNDGSIELSITGPATYNVTVDGVPYDPLNNVMAGTYTIPDLADGMHKILVYNVFDSYCDEEINVMIQDGGASYNLSENIAACLNENVTYPDGSSEVVTQNTSHVSNLLTTRGCDSVIVTNVTITPNKTNTVYESVCFGEKFTSPQGNIYGEGSFNETYKATWCDSIVTFVVTEKPKITNTVNVTVCFEELFTSPQGNDYGEGPHDEIYESASGCDSTVTFVVTERDEITQTQNETVCYGELFTSPQGNDYGEGPHDETYQSVVGCDSIVTFVVTERLEITNTVNELVCFEVFYTSPQGNDYGPGSHNETHQSAVGCDSTVTFVVTERPEVKSTANKIVCYGAKFTSPQGKDYGEGSYDETYFAVTGCDSVVTFVITERIENTHTVNETVCFGVLFSSPQGNKYGPGSFDELYTAVFGCDSIVTFEVTELAEVLNTVNETVCFGSLFTSPQGNSYSAGSFNETSTAASGCDSVVTFIVKEIDEITYTLVKKVCSGGQYIANNGNVYNPGTYAEVLQSSSGCDSLFTLIITEYNLVKADFFYNSTELTSLNTEAQFENHSSEADFYIWDFGDKTPNSYEESPFHQFELFEAGTYEVKLIAANEFDCSDTIVKTVLIREELIFYIPNAFTPDGDEFNQTFKPIFSSGFNPFDYVISIYSRWGDVIFESRDSNVGWDGKYNGKFVQAGIYNYKVQFKETSTTQQKYQVGHVNILR
jgi:gliding motility-associated-like protein